MIAERRRGDDHRDRRVELLGSVLVSVAVSLFEGDMLHRITSEFRLAWWLYIVNPTLAGMVLALALINPALTVLGRRAGRCDVVPDPALRRGQPAAP